MLPTDAPDWQIRRYLRIFDNDERTPVFWRVYDDKGTRRELHFGINAALLEMEPRLRSLNAAGAGVHVAIGRIHGHERLDRNVHGIRVLVLDLDTAPLPDSFEPMERPHAVVASSPGRWHCYWRVDEVPREAFSIVQRKLAALFDGDPCVSTLNHTIRAAGFLHQKKGPFLTRIVVDEIERPPHRFADLAKALRHVNGDAVRGAAETWIRDRQSGLIIDQRILTHLVWTEALRFDTQDQHECALRAWGRCQQVADVTRLAGHCSWDAAQSIAQSAGQLLWPARC